MNKSKPPQLPHENEDWLKKQIASDNKSKQQSTCKCKTCKCKKQK